jgi:hypothetical protein
MAAQSGCYSKHTGPPLLTWTRLQVSEQQPCKNAQDADGSCALGELRMTSFLSPQPWRSSAWYALIAEIVCPSSCLKEGI